MAAFRSVHDRLLAFKLYKLGFIGIDGLAKVYDIELKEQNMGIKVSGERCPFCGRLLNIEDGRVWCVPSCGYQDAATTKEESLALAEQVGTTE